MPKITLTDIANPSAGSIVSATNTNNTLIEAAIEKTLSRDGTSPNEMNANLDMNSNRILNLPFPESSGEPYRKADLDIETFENWVQAAEDSAQEAAESAQDAEDFAQQAGSYVSALSGLIYKDRFSVQGSSIPNTISGFTTNGDDTEGDGQGNTFVRVAGDNAWRNTVTSADGTVWYEAGDILRPVTARIPQDFPNLSSLFSYLNYRRIKAQLTVALSAGVVLESAPLVITHPDGVNIQITGTYFTINIASVGSYTSNSAYSQDVPLTLTSAVNVSVGDWLFIPAQAVPTKANRWLTGSWRVISKVGNLVTVRTTHASTEGMGTISDVNIACEVHKSIVRWDSTASSGITVEGANLGLILRVVLDGSFDVASGPGSDVTGGYGFSICNWVHVVPGLPGNVQTGGGVATLRFSSVVRWMGSGVLALGASSIDDTYSNMCSNGWRGNQTGDGSSSIFGKSCVLSGNRKAGVTTETNGSFTHNNSTIWGNGEQGAYVIGSGCGFITGATIGGNQTGAEARDAGYIEASNAAAYNNGAYAFIAMGKLSAIRIDGITSTGHTSGCARVEYGGAITARINPPTISDTTPYSISANYPGEIIVAGIYGNLTALVLNSATSPNGGAVLNGTSIGSLVVSQRTDGATSATTPLISFDTSQLRPTTDNTIDLGRAANRFRTVYAGTGTINTSDQNLKQDIRDISESERRVAEKCLKLIKCFRFKDAVLEKGSNARIHVGVVAQEVAEAFQSEGLNAFDYGIVCYDSWGETQEELDSSGNVLVPRQEAGEIYGVRTDELTMFALAALNSYV